MRAEKSRHPRYRGSFRYAPQGVGYPPSTLKYDGEQTEDWIIYDVDPDAAPVDVAACTDLPQPGDPMEGQDDWMVARIDNLTDTSDVNKDTGNITCRCTIVYVPDPSKLPVEIHYNSNRVMEAIFTTVGTANKLNADASEGGEAVVNGADDPFNPPVQEARCILRIRVLKRYVGDEFSEASTISRYAEKLSSEAFTIPGIGEIDAGHCYCSAIEAPLIKEPVWHHAAQYDFEVDVDRGFVTRLLNCGSQYYGIDDKKHLFADDDGTPHGGIGLLEGAAKGTPAAPEYLEFDTKPRADFNELGLF